MKSSISSSFSSRGLVFTPPLKLHLLHNTQTISDREKRGVYKGPVPFYTRVFFCTYEHILLTATNFPTLTAARAVSMATAAVPYQRAKRSVLCSPTDQKQSQINLHQTQPALIALGATEEAQRWTHMNADEHKMIVNSLSHSDGRTCS